MITQSPKQAYSEITNKYIIGIKSIKYFLFPCLIMTIIACYTEVYAAELISKISSDFMKGNPIGNSILWLLFIYLTYSFSSEMHGWCFSGPIQYAFKKCMTSTLNSYINLGFQSFKEIGVGKILKIMERRSNSTGEIISTVLIYLIPIPISFIFMSASVLKEISFLIFVIVFLHVFFYIFLTVKITNFRTKLRKTANEGLNESNNISNEILSSYETVKAYNNEDYMVNRFDRQLNKIVKPISKLWRYMYILNLAQKLIFSSMDIMVLLVFFLNRNEYANDLGVVAHYILLSGILRKKFCFLGTIYGTLMIMTANLVTSFVDDQKENKSGIQMQFNEKIEVVNLSLVRNSRQLLIDLNFTINKGEKVAIIGGNGSGKTTFIRVLLGFYDYTGSVIIDDKELREISKESLRNTIAFVPQDSSLMNDTIYENICYGTKFSDEKIVNVAEKFKINETILRLEDGYLTKTGERGKNLSGGEKQKIALLRAAIRDKPIFILDEPTASIDPIAEKEIFNVLLSKSNPTTTLVIVHNLDLLVNFDKIIYFDNGKACLYESYEDFCKANDNHIDFYKHLLLSSDKLNFETESAD